MYKKQSMLSCYIWAMVQLFVESSLQKILIDYTVESPYNTGYYILHLDWQWQGLSIDQTANSQNAPHS